MRRLGLVAGVLALIAAAPAPRAVHAQIVSGNRQTARAYVAPSESKYVTEFGAPLVVSVDVPARVGKKRRVRFRCVTKGCTLAPADQPDPDAVHVVWSYVSPESPKKNILDPTAKDADVVDGQASIGIAVEGARPDTVYTVTATPLARKGERAIPASFTLFSR